MSHEITSKDRVVLHQQPAWHGLGLVIDKEMTPREAARMVFPWEVEQIPMTIRVKGKQQIVDGYVMNVREDDGTQLGLVSESYQVIQPWQMAEFCEALLDADKEGQVIIETAGSIRSGRRIWFLLKGAPFEVANGDEIYTYLLISNGFDGLTIFRITPTTIRTVCSNTMHMVIPYVDTFELGTSAMAIRHTTNVMERIEEAKLALKNYGKAREDQKRFIETLVAKDVNTEAVQKFFLDAYTMEFGEIPANPKDGYEERRVLRAQSALASFSRRFDDEKSIAGTNMWCVFNAWTGLVQHDRKARGTDDADRLEKRVESNLFGLNADRTMRAAQMAFKAATVA